MYKTRYEVGELFTINVFNYGCINAIGKFSALTYYEASLGDNVIPSRKRTQSKFREMD